MFQDNFLPPAIKHWPQLKQFGKRYWIVT